METFNFNSIQNHQFETKEETFKPFQLQFQEAREKNKIQNNHQSRPMTMMLLQEDTEKSWDIIGEFTERIEEIPAKEFNSWVNELTENIKSNLTGALPLYDDKYSCSAGIIRGTYVLNLALMKAEMKNVWNRFPKIELDIISRVDFSTVKDSPGFWPTYDSKEDSNKSDSAESRQNIVISLMYNERKTYSAFIVKAMDCACDLDEQTNILKKYFQICSGREGFDEYYGLLTDLKRTIFVKYCNKRQKIWQSKQFNVDIQKEYFDSAKSDNMLIIYQLIISIITKSMGELSKIL